MYEMESCEVCRFYAEDQGDKSRGRCKLYGWRVVFDYWCRYFRQKKKKKKECAHGLQ